jgi:hypothetical protein
LNVPHIQKHFKKDKTIKMWKIKQIQSERKENCTKWKRITNKNGENININGTEKHQKF